MTTATRSLRLDMALVQRRLARSRAQARDLIRRGEVVVAGMTAVKAGQAVREDETIVVSPAEAAYVSRGAMKLLAALDRFEFDPAGRTALDIGASAGGFTQVLLERGATHVFAVDVGHGQLHPSLQGNARVTSLEGVDARGLTRELVPDGVAAIVADVSFISLTKALPAALALAAPCAWLVGLVKPQFEAGRKAVGKGGIVRDAAARTAALALVHDWMASQPGWRVVGSLPSPIAGRAGNQEYLLGAVREP